MNGISDAVNFDEAIPSLLDSGTTDVRMVETALALIGCLLRRIFHPDPALPPSPIFFSPCYAIGKKMYTLSIMQSLVNTLVQNRSNNKKDVIEIVAGE